MGILVKIFDFFSSIKLAVILILCFAVLTGLGTFYEAEYGTQEAQRVVYKSWYSILLMFVLVCNLACAAIDRMPWKKHHIGFVVTHLGIISLLMGSFITMQKGLDGSVALGISETTDTFLVPENEINVYQNFDGRPFAVLLQEEVDFRSSPPSKYPFEAKLVDDDVLRVINHYPKALRKVSVEKGEKKNLPAVEFTLSNSFVNVRQWLSLEKGIPPFYDLGPAIVTFVRGPLLKQPQPRNQILLHEENGILKYAIFSARQLKPVKTGKVKVGENIPTGWMGLQFQVAEYLPHAKPTMSYVEGTKDDQEAVEAVLVDLNGNKKWLEIGMPTEIKGKQSRYFVHYGYKRYKLGFKLHLKNFKMGLYGGSALPATYESQVVLDGKEQRTISMNEPLDNKGFRLFQASFEQNDKGEPTTSIFSVNYDPGRWIKYIASICIVLGIAIMFYWKPQFSRKPREKS